MPRSRLADITVARERDLHVFSRAPLSQLFAYLQLAETDLRGSPETRV